MVTLSRAVGSVPSLIALRKVAGVSIFSPSPSTRGDTIDSEAPIGVPAYFALMFEISWSYGARVVVSRVFFCCSKYSASAGSTFW
jgi:hypothetical protein